MRKAPSLLWECTGLGGSALLLCGSLLWSHHELARPAAPVKPPAKAAKQGGKVMRKPAASTKLPAKNAKKLPAKPATVRAGTRGRQRPVARKEASKPAATSRRKIAAQRPAKSSPASARGAVAVEQKQVLGVKTHVVTVNTASPCVRMTMALAAGGIGAREPWAQMIDRLRPTAAITGTYFDTATFVPVGGLVVAGNAIHSGGVGTALLIDKQGRPRLKACRPGRRMAWSDCDTGVRAGPRLLTRGQVTLYPQWEGFRDPAITARKPRAAIGITKHDKLLLVTVARPLYLSEMARVMRALGAVEAMCMDGGSSAGLYCRGKSYLVPRRSLTNVLVIYDSPDRFSRYARFLIPSAPLS